MITFLLVLAAAEPQLDVVTGGDFTLLDADLGKGLIVGESFWPAPGGEEGEEPPRCKNAFIKNRGAAIVVFDLRARKQIERVVLADFPEKGPCPTQVSFDKARADAVTKVKSLGLDLKRTDKPALIKLEGKAGGKAILDVKQWEEDEVMKHERRGVDSGKARLVETQYSYEMMMAGHGKFTSWLVEEDGAAMVIERAEMGNMRGSWTTWRAFGPLKLPDNGVDAAALAKAIGEGKCGASIAAPIAMEMTVAITVRHALDGGGKRKVPITKALQERDRSVVFAKADCADVAKAVAAAIPGGATVEALTWDSKAPVVVALGKSAAVAAGPSSAHARRE